MYTQAAPISARPDSGRQRARRWILTEIAEVHILQVRLVLVRYRAGIVLGVSFGKLLVATAVRDGEGEPEQEDHEDLCYQRNFLHMCIQKWAMEVSV